MSKRRPARRPECPTPWKVPFATESAGLIRIDSINSIAAHHIKTPQRAYSCECGAWHLTSQPHAY